MADRDFSRPLWTLGDVLGPALKGAGLTLQGLPIVKRKGLGGFRPHGRTPNAWYRIKRERKEENGTENTNGTGRADD